MIKPFASSETGCLLLHGYAGRPFEMSFLAARLREAGYTVASPALAGHDDNVRDFSHSRFQDWLKSADLALDGLVKQCPRVVVVGFSMGGTLALALAQKRQLAGVVTISTPVFLCRLHPYFSPDPLLFVSGILRHFLHSLPASPPLAESRRIAPWEGYEGAHYVGPLHSLKIAAADVRRGLHRVTAPIMALHGTRDRAVHPDNAWEILSHVSSTRRELHMLMVRETVTSGHLLVTHEETRGLAGTLVLEFVRSLEG